MANLAEDPRWNRIQLLFHEAVDLPVSAQLEYLNAACGGDEAMKSEILGMLEQDGGDGSLLNKGVPEVARALLDVSERSRTNIYHPYKIVRELGEGGMGIVYLAERENIGGMVAIKVLRDGLGSPARRERFAYEQRMLARLSHPAIAHIFDPRVSPDGVPWFAMEYVEGTSITEYCGSRKSSVAESLALFRAVCEAVQYAHAHAIIHRDLKPSNILVTAEGVVKLLDFGIAKQTDESGEPDLHRTQTGLTPMTVAYASPEQVRRERLDTRTDVYSLGVVLYELLTGALPFDLSGASPAEAERFVAQQEPHPPSAAATRQAGKAQWSDLDVLCLTAMHKDRERRYRSLEALIRDIDHYLKGEPLEARPDTLGYRTRKFVGRNRAWLGAAAAMLIVVGSLGAYSAVRLAKERSATLAEATRTKRIEQFMLNLFDGGDKEAGPAGDLRVVALLDRGVQNARALNSEPAVQADLYEALGGIYQKLGKYDQADSLLRSALEGRKAVAGAQSSDVADELVAMGRLRLAQGKYPEAERMLRDGLAIYRRNLRASDPAIAKASFALGTVIEEKGSYSEAVKILENAVQGPMARNETTADLSYGLSALASAHYYLGHLALASSLNQQALAIDRRLYGEVHPRVADDLLNLGEIEHDLGKDVQAENYYRKALAIKQSWYGKEHPDTAISMAAVGQSLIYQKRLDEAAPVLREAVAIQERVLGKMHPQLAQGLNMIGVLELKRGNLDASEAAFTRMREINKAAYGERHYLVGVAWMNLGEVEFLRNQPGAAERDYREALSRLSASLPAGHINIALVQVRLGHALVVQKRFQEADEHLLAAYEVFGKPQSNPGAQTRLQNAREDLASVYRALGQPEKAKKFQTEFEAADGIKPR